MPHVYTCGITHPWPMREAPWSKMAAPTLAAPVSSPACKVMFNPIFRASVRAAAHRVCKSLLSSSSLSPAWASGGEGLAIHSSPPATSTPTTAQGLLSRYLAANRTTSDYSKHHEHALTREKRRTSTTHYSNSKEASTSHTTSLKDQHPFWVHLYTATYRPIGTKRQEAKDLVYFHAKLGLPAPQATRHGFVNVFCRHLN